MFTIKIAEGIYTIDNRYPYIEKMCEKYLIDTTDAGDFISVSEDEIKAEDITNENYSMPYLETLAVYRKICNKSVFADTFLFHCSALAIDDCAICFTAPSGTGKSTQARLWREKYGRRITMINDDKPLISIRPDGPYIYGTPWCGKHGLSENVGMRLKAICIIERNIHNSVTPLSEEEAFPVMINQTYRPPQKEALSKTMGLLMNTIQNVSLYRVKCNISEAAVDVLMNVLLSEGLLNE